MGWLHTFDSTLKSTIKELSEESGNRKLLKKCFRGNPCYSGVLWSIWEIDCEDGERRNIIGCDILQYWNTNGGKGWAVKSIDETFGPYQYTCPLSYLKIASGKNSFEDNEYSKNWRGKVREYHNSRKNKINLKVY